MGPSLLLEVNDENEDELRESHLLFSFPACLKVIVGRRHQMTHEKLQISPMACVMALKVACYSSAVPSDSVFFFFLFFLPCQCRCVPSGEDSAKQRQLIPSRTERRLTILVKEISRTSLLLFYGCF